MAYGDKRDYKPIDIYLKRPGNRLEYSGTTTWAANPRIAREQYALAFGFAASDLAAQYKGN